MEDLGSIYTRDDNVQEVLIQTVGDRKRCFIRADSAVFLTDNCNPDDARQRWFALSGSFTPGSRQPGEPSRFEIGQYQGFTRTACVTVSER